RGCGVTDDCWSRFPTGGADHGPSNQDPRATPAQGDGAQLVQDQGALQDRHEGCPKRNPPQLELRYPQDGARGRSKDPAVLPPGARPTRDTDHPAGETGNLRRPLMEQLPTKPESTTATEVEDIPTWRDLADRFRDVMKDIAVDIAAIWKKEGKDLEREVQSRLLPALNRAKVEIDKLITRLEERQRKPG